MRTDLGSVRGAGWMQITCDAPACDSTVDWHVDGPPPEGWAQSTPLIATTSSVKDYCPAHAGAAA